MKLNCPDIIDLATKAALNLKAAETENKRPNTSSFITTPEFNRLTNISFDARMKEAEKILASKTEVKNALDVGDQNSKKKKIFKHLQKVLIQVIFLVKVILKMMGLKFFSISTSF